MSVIIYLRVSTDQQELGMDTQLSSCNEFVKKHGYTISNIFRDENISGDVHYEWRPGLNKALEVIKKGDIFLVSHRDRLSRNVTVMGRIEYEIVDKRGALILSVAGEGIENENQLYRRIIDAFAEHEKIIIKQRIKNAMASKKSRNEYLGTAPIGYKVSSDGINLEPDQTEISSIKKIKKLRKNKMTLQGIATYLNQHGILNRGNTWTRQSVTRRLILDKKF